MGGVEELELIKSSPSRFSSKGESIAHFAVKCKLFFVKVEIEDKTIGYAFGVKLIYCHIGQRNLVWTKQLSHGG